MTKTERSEGRNGWGIGRRRGGGKAYRLKSRDINSREKGVSREIWDV